MPIYTGDKFGFGKAPDDGGGGGPSYPVGYSTTFDNKSHSATKKTEHKWVVPKTARYNFEVWGADGGMGLPTSNSQSQAATPMMGFGGKFEGSFVLTAGTEIGLMIGIPGKPTKSYETNMNYTGDDWGWGGFGMPGMTSGGSAGGGNSRATINGNRGNYHTSDPRGGGGGGGTIVRLFEGTSASDILIVAGGGGGAGGRGDDNGNNYNQGGPGGHGAMFCEDPWGYPGTQGGENNWGWPGYTAGNNPEAGRHNNGGNGGSGYYAGGGGGGAGCGGGGSSRTCTYCSHYGMSGGGCGNNGQDNQGFGGGGGQALGAMVGEGGAAQSSGDNSQSLGGGGGGGWRGGGSGCYGNGTGHAGAGGGGGGSSYRIDSGEHESTHHTTVYDIKGINGIGTSRYTTGEKPTFLGESSGGLGGRVFIWESETDSYGTGRSKGLTGAPLHYITRSDRCGMGGWYKFLRWPYFDNKTDQQGWRRDYQGTPTNVSGGCDAIVVNMEGTGQWELASVTVGQNNAWDSPFPYRHKCWVHVIPGNGTGGVGIATAKLDGNMSGGPGYYSWFAMSQRDLGSTTWPGFQELFFDQPLGPMNMGEDYTIAIDWTCGGTHSGNAGQLHTFDGSFLSQEEFHDDMGHQITFKNCDTYDGAHGLGTPNGTGVAAGQMVHMGIRKYRTDDYTGYTAHRYWRYMESDNGGYDSHHPRISRVMLSTTSNPGDCVTIKTYTDDNCRDSGEYSSIDTGTYDHGSPIAFSHAFIRSVYGGKTGGSSAIRSRRYRVDYSDDGINWTIAWYGVAHNQNDWPSNGQDKQGDPRGVCGVTRLPGYRRIGTNPNDGTSWSGNTTAESGGFSSGPANAFDGKLRMSSRMQTGGNHIWVTLTTIAITVLHKVQVYGENNYNSTVKITVDGVEYTSNFGHVHEFNVSGLLTKLQIRNNGTGGRTYMEGVVIDGWILNDSGGTDWT